MLHDGPSRAQASLMKFDIGRSRTAWLGFFFLFSFLLFCPSPVRSPAWSSPNGSEAMEATEAIAKRPPVAAAATPPSSSPSSEHDEGEPMQISLSFCSAFSPTRDIIFASFSPAHTGREASSNPTIKQAGRRTSFSCLFCNSVVVARDVSLGLLRLPLVSGVVVVAVVVVGLVHQLFHEISPPRSTGKGREGGR